MSKNKFGINSTFDAFIALNEILEEEKPSLKKRLKNSKLDEGVSVDVRSDAELDAAKQLRETKAEKDDTLEVIDVDADAVDQLQDNSSYVGKMLLQCNSCKATRFMNIDDLKRDENDKDLYNLEDECPHCHHKGSGYTLIGQVGETPQEEENTEASFDNEEASEEAVFDNTDEVENAEEETSEEQSSTEDAENETEESSYDETSSSDDTDEVDLAKLGDEFDVDDVLEDDTEEADEEDRKVKKESLQEDKLSDTDYFIQALKELYKEDCAETGDNEYDCDWGTAAYEACVETLKEECGYFDDRFDNLTHTIVDKIDEMVEKHYTYKQIIDTLISEASHESLGENLAQELTEDENAGKFIVDSMNDFDIELPKYVVLTDNGAYDLEQKGKSGHYVWIGFQHGYGFGLARMRKPMLQLADKISDIYKEKYGNKARVDDFTKSSDMYRVWVETNNDLQEGLFNTTPEYVFKVGDTFTTPIDFEDEAFVADTVYEIVELNEDDTWLDIDNGKYALTYVNLDHPNVSFGSGYVDGFQADTLEDLSKQIFDYDPHISMEMINRFDPHASYHYGENNEEDEMAMASEFDNYKTEGLEEDLDMSTFEGSIANLIDTFTIEDNPVNIKLLNKNGSELGMYGSDDLPFNVKSQMMDTFNTDDNYLEVNVTQNGEGTTVNDLFNYYRPDENNQTTFVVTNIDTDEEQDFEDLTEFLEAYGDYYIDGALGLRTLNIYIADGDLETEVEPLDDEELIELGKENAEKEEAEVTEESLIEEIIKSYPGLKLNRINNSLAEEYFIAESIRLNEDIDLVYKNFVKPTDNEKLIEHFKSYTGYEDEVDKFLREHNISKEKYNKIINESPDKLGLDTEDEIEGTYQAAVDDADKQRRHAYNDRENTLNKYVVFLDLDRNGNEYKGYVNSEFDSEEFYWGDVITPLSNINDLYLFDSYDEALEAMNQIINQAEDMSSKAIENGDDTKELKVLERKIKQVKELYNSTTTNEKLLTSVKTRAELGEAISKLVSANEKYRIAKSLTEGYRYDVFVNENCKLNEGLFDLAKEDEPETTALVPEGMREEDVEIVNKIDRIAEDIANAIENTYGVPAKDKKALIVADIIRDLQLIGGEKLADELEDTPWDNLTKQMYQEFNGFYDALDDLVSFTTGQRITTSQADKLQQAIRSLDGPSFETEEIQKQVESPQFLQAIQQGLIPYITPQELQAPEVSESCNEAVDSFLVDEDGDIEDPSFNLNTFGKNQVNEDGQTDLIRAKEIWNQKSDEVRGLGKELAKYNLSYTQAKTNDDKIIEQPDFSNVPEEEREKVTNLYKKYQEASRKNISARDRYYKLEDEVNLGLREDLPDNEEPEQTFEFENAEDVEKRLGELNYLQTQRELTPEEEKEFYYCQNLISNKWVEDDMKESINEDFNLNEFDEAVNSYLNESNELVGYRSNKLNRDNGNIVIEGVMESDVDSKPVTFLITKNENADNYTVSNNLFEDKFILEL